MIETSVLGKLWRMILWLGSVMQESMIYHAVSSGYGFLKRCASSSKVCRFFWRDSKLALWYESSVFARIVNGIFDWLVKVFSRFFGWLLRLNQSSLNRKFYQVFLKNLFYFKYEYMLGAFFALMLLAPHEMWSNTYALLGAGAFLVLYFILVTVNKRKQFRITDMGLPFLIFAFMSAVSVLLSYARHDSLRVFFFFVASFLLAITIVLDATDEEKLHRILSLLYIGVLITSVYAIYQRFTGVAVSSEFTDLELNADMPGRVYSTFSNPNNYAEVLILLMPLCVAFVMGCKRTWQKWVGGVLFILPVVALLMTYSRSCWVSFALATVAFIFLYRKKWIPALFVLAVAAVPFLPASIINRILTIGSKDDSSNSYRIYIWEGVWKMLKDFWVTGIGLGPETFSLIYPRYANPIAISAPHSHMLYLELLVETGMVGFLSFLWYILSLIKQAIKSAYRTVSKQNAVILIAGASALIGISFACAAEYIWFYPRVMFVFFMVTGILGAAIRNAKKEQENAE